MLVANRPRSRSFRPRRRRRAAFTFIELLIVLLILGIVTAVAAPRTADAITRLRATAAAKRIVADLNFARRTAATSGKSQSVQFDVANNCYQLPGVSHLDRPTANYKVDLADTGYPVVLMQADFGGSGTVAFDLYGRPSSGGAIIVKSGSFQKTITLDADTGKATIP